MSRRRGVVVSDDEETPAAAPSRQSHGRTSSSRRPATTETGESSSARVKKGPPNKEVRDVPEEILNLPSVSNYNPQEIQGLLAFKDDNKKLIHGITASLNVIFASAIAVAELKDPDGKTERIAMLERSLMDMIDASQHLKHVDKAIETTCTASSNAVADEPLALNEILVNDTTRHSKPYLAQSDEKKYSNVAEFLDFKRGVWDILHKNKPIPENWFTSTESDDDIVIDQEIQSLKCPITLQLLEKPVQNVNCPHVYSMDAIKELVRQAGGKCRCPVSGCQKEVTMKGVREDKVMARKVREERARLEERADEERMDFQEITEGEITMAEDMKSES